MSADALRSVLRNCSKKKRLEMAVLDQEMYPLAVCFQHFTGTIIDDEFVAFGNKEYYCIRIDATRGDHHLEQVFRHCPSLLKIMVQTRLTMKEAKLLLEEKGELPVGLALSNENFADKSGLLQVLGEDKLQFPKLQKLMILQRLDRPMTLSTRISAQKLKPLLSPSLTCIGLTGIVLLPCALKALFSADGLPNLVILGIRGSLVDSREAAATVPSLSSPPRLEFVSLPPSFFSFSRLKDNKPAVPFDFKWLHVAELLIYMESFCADTFFHQLDTMFAKELKVLNVNGNVTKLKSCGRVEKYKKIKITCTSDEAVVLNPSYIMPSPAASVTPKLVCGLTRSWPYTRDQNSTAHTAAGAPSSSRDPKWLFSLADACDAPPIRVAAVREPDQNHLLGLLLGRRNAAEPAHRLRRAATPPNPAQQPQQEQPPGPAQPAAALAPPPPPPHAPAEGPAPVAAAAAPPPLAANDAELAAILDFLLNQDPHGGQPPN